MAPLSRFLSGIILPYETFESHLNSRGETINEEIELQNFRKAGETLADVWNEAFIDKFPVVAQWRGGHTADHTNVSSQEWMAKHVRSNQYLLQIVKCNDEECCSPLRSTLKSLLPQRFLLSPLSVSNERGLSYVSGEQHKFLPLILRLTSNILPEGWSENNKTLIPYDFYCPTVQNQITNRTCNDCKLYFASTTMMMQHKKVIHPRHEVNEMP